MVECVCESSKNQDDNNIQDWKEDRPWDPPITDFDLPQRVIRDAVGAWNDNIYTSGDACIVYSSPFRRCLQTAAVVALALEKKHILVHPGLGEVMARARKCLSNEPQEEIENYLLSQDDSAKMVEQASGGKVTIKSRHCTAFEFSSAQQVPPWKETYAESMARLETVLKEIHQYHSCLLYTSPSPRDQRGSRMPSSA